MVLRTLAVAALLLLGPDVADAGQCAPTFLSASPATPATVEIPSDGGLLVIFESLRSAPEDLSKWKFSTKGKQRSTPVATTIAPGLVRLTPAGTQLTDGAKRVLVTFTRATTPAPALAAPKVKSLTFHQGRRGSGVTAELSTAIDTGFLVVFDADGKVARSWGRVSGTKASVYRTGDCTEVASGTIPSRGGDKVRLALVDAFGRMSPLSTAVEIVEAPPTEY